MVKIKSVEEHNREIFSIDKKSFLDSLVWLQHENRYRVPVMDEECELITYCPTSFTKEEYKQIHQTTLEDSELASALSNYRFHMFYPETVDSVEDILREIKKAL